MDASQHVSRRECAVPTHVGVNRQLVAAVNTRSRHHAREGARKPTRALKRSKVAVPTHVGVNRGAGVEDVALCRRPHGNVGVHHHNVARRIRLVAVPTHVGVNRRDRVPAGLYQSRPHARGKVNRRRGQDRSGARPHARGGEPRRSGLRSELWAAVPTHVGVNPIVHAVMHFLRRAVPTHVGVNHSSTPIPVEVASRPHARDGEPDQDESSENYRRWPSPRTWG